MGRENYLGIITIACLLIAITVFPKLPPQIPIQWNNGVANYVDKNLFMPTLSFVLYSEYFYVHLYGDGYKYMLL